MIKTEPLDFLQKKIQEIKVAMFKAEIDSILQLPNAIVRIIKTDDNGNIWFFTSCNSNYAKNIDKDFYAYLDFYQKGNDCRLCVSGKASLIEDGGGPANTPVINMGSKTRDVVLIKLKIMHAEYSSSRHPELPTLGARIKHFISELFMPEEPKMYNFSS